MSPRSSLPSQLGSVNGSSETRRRRAGGHRRRRRAERRGPQRWCLPRGRRPLRSGDEELSREEGGPAAILSTPATELPFSPRRFAYDCEIFRTANGRHDRDNGIFSFPSVIRIVSVNTGAEPGARQGHDRTARVAWGSDGYDLIEAPQLGHHYPHNRSSLPPDLRLTRDVE